MISTLQRFGLWLAVASLLPTAGLSQGPSQTASHTGGCGTDDYYREMLADPAMRAQHERMDAAMRQFIADNKLRAHRTASGTPYYVIPTVVHVVWGDSTANPLGRDSISLQQVQSNFVSLFQDFRNMPGTPGYTDRGVDYRVEFSLATKDPNGNPTTGVNYVYDPTLAIFNRDVNETDLKSGITWPKNRYFNVWLINRFTQGNLLGYAFFPLPGAQPDDGVVIRSDCWGTVGTAGGPNGDNDMGRTATHELGHWVRLFHPFSPGDNWADNGVSGCGTSNCANSGDQICDTPPQKTSIFGLGNLRVNSCQVETPDRPDNRKNFMDYLNDVAVNHFTPQQRDRSWAVLDNDVITQRYNLWQDSNLQFTGTGPYKKPTAQFVADRRTTQQGFGVQFTDYSRDVPASWSWSFEGGSPANSADPNPLVNYSTPGSYDVQLIVNNASNQPDTILLPDYITVTGDVSVPLPLTEFFDASGSLPNGWSVSNTDAAHGTALSMTWGINQYQQGSRAAIMNFFQYSIFGQRDYLNMPPLNLLGVNEAHMSFVVGYQNYRETNIEFPIMFTDTFMVEFSVDGGLNWSQMFRGGGSQIAWTTASTTTQFIPGAGNWRRFNLCMDHVANQPNVMLRFASINGFGSNLFIDSVSVQPIAAPGCLSGEPAAAHSLLAQEVVVAPNPFGATTTLLVDLREAAIVQAEVLDATGRLVLELPERQLPPGQSALALELGSQPAGLYFVNLRLGAERVSRKVVKQ